MTSWSPTLRSMSATVCGAIASSIISMTGLWAAAAIREVEDEVVPDVLDRLALLEPFERHREAGDVLGGGARRRQAGSLAFERDAGLGQLLRGDAATEDRDPHAAVDARRGLRADERAAARTRLDEAQLFHRAEGLADERAADAIASRQRTLRGQHVAGALLARHDVVGDRRGRCGERSGPPSTTLPILDRHRIVHRRSYR